MIRLNRIAKKTWFIIGVIALIAVVLLYGAAKRQSNGSARFEFVEVERGNLENTISSTGTLYAKSTVEVGTQVSGTIDRVYTDFNDQVRKGQILAVLEATLLAASVRDAEANYLRAQAQYALSLTKYENAQNLYKKEFISELDLKTTKTDHETARATLLSAQATLDRAEVNMKYAVIRSPINGTVINRKVEPGQTVASSFSTPTLFVIAEDLSQMEIHAYVDESDIGQIKEGQVARFTVESYPNDSFFGTVRQIRLQPETIQNVVNYIVVVDATNDKGLLLPGMTATIDFVIEQRQNVLLIPNKALRFQPTEEMLAKFRKNMKEKRAIVPDSVNKLKNQTKVGEGIYSGLPALCPQAQEMPSKSAAVLWYLDDKHRLRMICIQTGVTDGLKTEIVQSPGIKEGMEFISGIANQKTSKPTTSKTNQKQQRAPGPPPLF